MHNPTDRITHTTAFVATVVEYWPEREIVQWVHHEGSIRRPFAHQERTLLARIKSGVQLVPHCSVTCYRTQSEALFGNILIAIMPRLTEVERGQAISQVLQSHTQRPVAVQFGVNVRTVQHLVCLQKIR